jgi:hypothetical protein
VRPKLSGGGGGGGGGTGAPARHALLDLRTAEAVFAQAQQALAEARDALADFIGAGANPLSFFLYFPVLSVP